MCPSVRCIDCKYFSVIFWSSISAGNWRYSAYQRITIRVLRKMNRGEKKKGRKEGRKEGRNTFKIALKALYSVSVTERVMQSLIPLFISLPLSSVAAFAAEDVFR